MAGLAALTATAVLAVVLLISGGALRAGEGDVREIQLVARGMTFYLEGDDTPNPALRFRGGERVRIRLRNEEAGMAHDFAVSSWQVGTKLLQTRDEDAILVTVPSGAGAYAYTCTPHAQMMRGTIVVE